MKLLSGSPSDRPDIVIEPMRLNGIKQNGIAYVSVTGLSEWLADCQLASGDATAQTTFAEIRKALKNSYEEEVNG